MRRSKIAILSICILLLATMIGCGQSNQSQTASSSKSEPGKSEPTKAQSAQKPITLNWVTFQPAKHPEVNRMKEVFWKKVSEKTQGQVEVMWKGGPELMNSSDMGLAVQRGTIDIATIFVGAYEGVVPGIGAWSFSEITPDEERKPGGAVDYIEELHKKAGLKYLGRVQPQEEPFFYTWLKDKKPQKKEDFANMVLGTSGSVYAGAVVGWGGKPENVKSTENYAALEHGVVQGINAQPLEGAVANGWDKLAKYVIDHPYHQSPVVFIMNLNTWNKLTKEQQDAITQAMIEGEKENLSIRKDIAEKARKQIEKDGVEFYKLSPDVAQWYIDIAYSSAWDDAMKKYPDVTAKLKDFIKKKN